MSYCLIRPSAGFSCGACKMKRRAGFDEKEPMAAQSNDTGKGEKCGSWLVAEWLAIVVGEIAVGAELEVIPGALKAITVLCPALVARLLFRRAPAGPGQTSTEPG